MFVTQRQMEARSVAALVFHCSALGVHLPVPASGISEDVFFSFPAEVVIYLAWR